MESYQAIGYHTRRGGETHVWYALFDKIVCKQNLTDRSERGIPILQNQQICTTLSRNRVRIKVLKIRQFFCFIHVAFSFDLTIRFCFRFVLNTDTAAASVKEFLQQYYAKIWVEYVVKNPLWIPGTPVTSDLFKQKSDQYIRQSPMFVAKSAS